MSIKSVRLVDLVVVNVQFCIRKNGMQNFVHMSNMRHSLVLFYKFNVIVSCFSKNSVFFVLPFLFCCFVSIKTTSFNYFNFWSKLCLSQILVNVAIRLKFKLNAVFIKRCIGKNFLLVRRQHIVHNWDFHTRIPRNCNKSLVPKFF